MYGTEITIGVDTALNTVLDCIDMIRATASSHQRAFLIEVMGRHCGYLALIAGIAAGAEMICIPEKPFELDDVAAVLDQAYVRGKAHCIVVVAEGAQYNALTIEKYLRESRHDLGFDVRSSILGYIQRGGKPTAYERLLATRLGAFAVDCLAGDQHGVMVGVSGHQLITTPLPDVVSHRQELDLSLHDLARRLENPQSK